MKQQSFGFLKDYKKEFGGSLLIGKRKSRRPLSSKHPIHLVLKCSGKSYFSPGHAAIEKVLRTQAKKYRIIIYDLSLNWSHMHIVIKIPDRAAFLAFIRTVTVRFVEFLSKRAGKTLSGIFDLRPYTRVLSWGRQFQCVREYAELNDQEARGLINRKKLNNPPRNE